MHPDNLSEEEKNQNENNIFQNLNEKYFKIKECLFRCGNIVQDINSKKEKDFFIIPKGEFVKIEDNKYATTLYKIKYKKKKFLVSKEEFDYCAFNCDSNYNYNYNYNYNNCYEK